MTDEVDRFAAEHDMDRAEAARYLDICERRIEPTGECYDEGWFAFGAGDEHGECPYPKMSVKALCWRLGWLHHAMKAGAVHQVN